MQISEDAKLHITTNYLTFTTTLHQAQRDGNSSRLRQVPKNAALSSQTTMPQPDCLGTALRNGITETQPCPSAGKLVVRTHSGPLLTPEIPPACLPQSLEDLTRPQIPPEYLAVCHRQW